MLTSEALVGESIEEKNHGINHEDGFGKFKT